MGKRIDKAKGRAKQAVGSLTGNEKLKLEGQADELEGKVDGAVKDVKKVVKQATESVKKTLK